MLPYRSLTKYRWAIYLLLTPPAYCNTLLETVELGLQNNLSIRASLKGLEESENNIGVSRSKFLPSLSATANTNWSENNAIRSGEVDDASHSQTSGVGLSLSQTIFNLGDIYKYQTAKLNYDAEELSHENQVQSVIVEIATNYFEYLKNNAQIKATEVELKSSISRENQMRRNVELGNTAGSEMYEVTAQKEEVSNRLRSLRKDREVLLNDLSLLIQYPVVPSQDLYSRAELDAFDKTQTQALITDALKFNSDVLIARNTLEVTRQGLKESAANFVPTLQMTGGYNYDYTHDFEDTADPAATGKSDSANIGLNLNIPILSGGSDYYDYQKSSKSIERQEILYQDTLFSTRNEVNTVIMDINDLSDSVESYERIIRANYASYRGIQRAQQLGTRTITDLLAAESKLFNAVRDYQNTRYDYAINIINLEKSKGSLSIESIQNLMSLMVEMNPETDEELIPMHLLD
ncbi:TolC family protein [Vibrio agarivorans]|uniref:TolC family protein n=1 Tax=Vibrio agarivorans TaxID=153622 RepID=A0ABT7Y512_9VIBR|nr:TolC family protein [Vibrio agarivorans]MDN2483090.1 TolC family protein [Vibrio agarivorans]